jgi:protein SCO1/2
MASRLLHSGLAALITLCAFGTSASAGDRMEKLPKELSGVTLHEKLSDTVPLDTSFVDERGKPVRLGDLFSTKPVILTFNYSNCPMLCSVQLGGLVDTMLQMDWDIGKQFDIITISLDPKETTVRARETKSRYLERYERVGADENWHFLTGSEADIKTIADAVGFGYRYHPERKEYLHPAVLTLVSPRGIVSGYMAGVQYDPIDLRDKLIVASVGDVSEELAEFILSCYHYEATTGNGAIVQKIMRYGGLVFVLGFACALAIFGLKRSHAHVHAHQVGSTEDHV